MSARPDSGSSPFDVVVLLAPADDREVLAVLADLPAALPAAVLIGPSLHGQVRTVEAVSRHTTLPVRPAEHGTVLQPGQVYLSPPHAVLEVRPDRRCAVIPPQGELSSERPLDRLLASLAVNFESRALAVILAGPGRDGVTGARALRGVGGTVLVQDPATADPADLPRAVVEAGAADRVVPLREIGPAVAHLLAGRDLPGEATVRAPAQETPARFETPYRTLFDAIDEGFCIIEVLFGERGNAVDYRFLTMNPAFVRQTGLEGATGRTIREFAPGHEPFWFEVYGEIARTGEARRFEHHAGALSPPRDYEVYAFRIGEPGERQVAVLFKDISERKQAERDLRSTNQLLRTVFDSSLEYLQLFQAVRNEKGNIVDFEWRLTNKPWNDQWGEMAGKRLLTENPAVIETGLFEKFKRVTESGVPDTHEHYYAHEQFDGWFVQTAAKAEDGFLLSTLDITARKRAEEAEREHQERQVFLLKFSDALRAQPNEQAIKNQAVHLLAEHLRLDRCYISEVFEQEGISTVGPEHHRPDLPPMSGVFRLAEYPETMRQLATQPMVVQDAADDARFSASEKELLAALHLRALLVVALRKGPRHVIWALATAMATPRRWTDGERGLLEEVAERTWAAVERARAEEVLRASEKRQAFLLMLSDRLRPEVDERAIALTSLRLLAEHLRLDRAYVARVDKGRDRAEIGPEYRRPDLAPVEGVLTLSDFPEAFARVEGATLVLADPASDRALSELDRQGFAELRMGALIVASARKGTRNPVWALLVAVEQPRRWTASEVALVEEVAERTWAAVERARAETALQRSEEKYRTLFNSIDEGVGTVELIFGGDGRVVDHVYLEQNPAFERLTGLPSSAVGRRISEVVPDLEPFWFETFERVARTGVPERFEHEVAALGRWFEVYVARVGSNPNQVVYVYNNITERRRAEEELRALNASLEARVEEGTRRVADLNAELGALITRTARNLEAPVGYLSRFLAPGRPEDLLAELPPHSPSLLEDELARLKGVVQDLRQLARLEQQNVTRDLLPLGELFGDVQAQVSATPRGSQVHWLLEPLPIVRGDRALLRQALEVLMTFTLSETRGARYVTVSSQEVEGEVWITVEDDGIGLTGEEAATLFDLAVRTDQEAPVLEGSGLIQVRRILARHGGWAWAEAQRTRGKVVLAFPQDEAVQGLEALLRQDRPGT